MTRHYLYDRLRPHIGHNLVCVSYGGFDDSDLDDIYIECIDCNEVLISVETFEEEEVNTNEEAYQH